MGSIRKSSLTDTVTHRLKYGKNRLLCLAVSVMAVVSGLTGCSGKSRTEPAVPSGEALFQRHCAGCHPQGRNLLYPSKDLRLMTLAANGITTPDDILKIMRNPGNGMPRFAPSDISDADSRAIGTYILATFR